MISDEDCKKLIEEHRQAVAEVEKIKVIKQVLKYIKELDEELDNDNFNRYSHSDFAYKLEDILKAKVLQEKQNE